MRFLNSIFRFSKRQAYSEPCQISKITKNVFAVSPFWCLHFAFFMLKPSPYSISVPSLVLELWKIFGVWVWTKNWKIEAVLIWILTNIWALSRTRNFMWVTIQHSDSKNSCNKPNLGKKLKTLQHLKRVRYVQIPKAIWNLSFFQENFFWFCGRDFTWRDVTCYEFTDVKLSNLWLELRSSRCSRKHPR